MPEPVAYARDGAFDVAETQADGGGGGARSSGINDPPAAIEADPPPTVMKRPSIRFARNTLHVPVYNVDESAAPENTSPDVGLLANRIPPVEQVGRRSDERSRSPKIF